MRSHLVLLLLSLMLAFWPVEADDAQDVRQRLERLAAATTHFATDDIIVNRWSEGRWPAGLGAQQQHVLDELRAVRADRERLVRLLGHSDPRVRTLALGALFVREDPQDLPSIARLTGDVAATFPRLGRSLDSGMDTRPLSEVESPQTVADVANAMIAFYLRASSTRSGFKEYWAERRSRDHTAGWFLVKMHRATGQRWPLRPQHHADMSRVLAEINALPPADRAWTLLYVWSLASQLEPLVPKETVIRALQRVGPDQLIRFLRGRRISNDPDLRLGSGNETRPANSMTSFILRNARDLLRASDASALLAEAEVVRQWYSPVGWIAAASELRAKEDVEGSATFLKDQIERIPLRGYEGQEHQAILAATLWRMRGADERVYFTDWFYKVLPLAREHMAHGPQTFFRAIETEARADTPSLLSAIVNDSRFTRADWPSLAMLLKLVNSTIPVPLVDWRAVYDNQPDLDRPDQRETLTVWRNLLRRHFGGAALPTAAPVPTSVRTVSKPAWLVESGRARFDWAVMSLSSDGRMLATDGVEDRTIAVRSTESGELLSRLRAPAGARWVLAAFATGAATPTLFFSAGTNRLGIGGSNAGGALEAEGITANGLGAVDRALTRYAYATGVYDLKGAKNLWRFHDNSSGQRGQVAISADGRLAAVGAGNWPQLVRLFDAASGVLLHEIVEFSSPVASLALTPDGEFLAAASQSDGVRLWDTRTGSIRHRLAYPVGASRVARPVLAVSPDGRWLAVAYRSRIGVFSVSSGELRWEIQLGEGNDASAMLFSIDGTHLYTAGDGLAAWRLD